MRKSRVRGFRIALAVGAVLFLPGVAGAAVSDCAVDYDLDTARTALDVGIFAGLYPASSNTDLNGDGVQNGFDLNTLVAYFGFTVCPWKGDYQYNRVIDTVDSVIFQFLWGIGSLRADLDNDGLVTAADVAAFNAAFGTVY